MSSSCDLSNVPKEYDSEVRKALFYLYSNPLPNIFLGDSDDGEMHHWFLVAKFEDKSVRTLEANKEHGKLIPTFDKESPSPVRGLKFQFIGSVVTSPLKLREIAINNSLNGKDYHAVKNNCQHWVKAAAKAISPNLARAIDNYKTNSEITVTERMSMCFSSTSRSSKKLLVAASNSKKNAQPMSEDTSITEFPSEVTNSLIYN